MKMQNRCAQSQHLPQLVQDQLREPERSTLETHLESCEACQSALDLLVESDETAAKLSKHLRTSQPVSDKVLLDVMDRIRSTTAGPDAPEPFRLEDFAVEYLQPSYNSKAMGRLGHYEITEVIGCGGMGIVLKGFDPKLNRVVAVKALTPAFASNSTARKRFLREAQAAAAVGHPNVVTIHSVDEDRLPYLVMEFVDGPSLQKRLDSEGFLQLNQILRIGVQVAAGLAAAHAQGLVHRDIKPGNILLESGMERVKITDFGLARAADDASVTREGTIVGTPQYMSPEQARGESVDQTSDLFSLGSVLYALATGRPPFRAETPYGVMRKITDETPTPIRELNPEIPDWLCDIITRLMAKEKHDRFQTVAEVHELLEACLSHAQQPTMTGLPEIPKLNQTRRISRNVKILAGAIAMVTITAGLMFILGVPVMFQLAPAPEESAAKVTPANDGVSPFDKAAESDTYRKDFVLAFPNPDEIGTLNVDIKRGTIDVTGYDGDKILVELTVPNFEPSSRNSADGLKTLRPNTIDFDIEPSAEQIKLDGNSYDYVTNLKIKVPRTTNLILDTYRDGLIHVKDVEGTFKVRSNYNNIRLEGVYGSGRLWSYQGNLTADFIRVAKGRPLYLETYNGSIDLTLPAGTKANTRYRSGTGTVSTDFDIQASEQIVQTANDGTIEFDEFVGGTLNGGGPALTMETENGDIVLRKRNSE